MEKRKWKPTHAHHHKKRSRDHSDEESEELSSTEKKSDFSEDSEERNRHIWTPAHRYLHKELRRSGDSSEEEEGHSVESEEDKKFRSDYMEDKRHHSAAISKEVFKQHGMEEDKEKEARDLDKKGKSHHTKQNEKEKEENKAAFKYLLAKKKSEEQRDLLNEEEVMEKRSPWEYRGYYHPAWWKRNVVRVAAPEAEDKTRWLKERLPHHLPEKRHYATAQMNQLAKLLNYKKAALAGQSEEQEEKQTLHQRPLTSKEVIHLATIHPFIM
ncbi:hypothetical protein GJAV_G00115270 [Gymnothorax javanicus]|nr:hypothetical protein GJAV_G00115270 [Gymnothorax javanicus]